MTDPRTTFSSFGYGPMAKGTLFSELGFLSDQAQGFRLSARGEHADLFETFRACVQASLSMVASIIDVPMGPDDWMPLAYWKRCLEACQGAVILTDLGMEGSAGAVLRTGYECLFYAAALWNDPTFKDELKVDEAFDHYRFAMALKSASKGGSLNAQQKEYVKRHSRKPKKEALKIWEVAKKANMSIAYDSIYRTLSTLGTHASPSSAHQFAVVPDGEGRFTSTMGPSWSGSRAHLMAAIECVKVANGRYEAQFRDHLSAAANPEGSPGSPDRPRR